MARMKTYYIEKDKDGNEKQYFLPINDYFFSRLFGVQENANLTKNMLSVLLKKDIIDLNVSHSVENVRNSIDEKISRLDVRATTESGEQIDIEMQVEAESGVGERLAYYWSRLYGDEKMAGKAYFDFKPAIVIMICGEENEITRNDNEICSWWQIRNGRNREKVLTDALKIGIISLEKFRKAQEDAEYAKTLVDFDEMKPFFSWLKFIRDPRTLEAEDLKKEEIKEAKEKYDELKNDEDAEYLAWLHDKYEVDVGVQKYYAYKEGQEDTVRKFKDAGVSIDLIAKATGLKKEEIEKL